MLRENLHSAIDVFITPAFWQLKNNDGLTRKKIVALGLPMLRAGTDIVLDDLVKSVASVVINDKPEHELLREASRTVCGLMLTANVIDFLISYIKASQFEIK